jgi:peptidoglycan/LPS O-acetylase OafA/YrhL
VSVTQPGAPPPDQQLRERAANRGMSHIPALDGIRSLAILGVFVFHALPRALPGGYTGVDVFFVLSGYLIASVILHDLRNRRFSMREFYLRRIQRLMPNAILTIAATMLLAAAFLLPSQTRTTAENGISALFEVSNFFIWKHFRGYWGDSASAAPLLHTWSLGVEEQFYMLFPLTLVLLARRTRPFASLATIALISFALCVYETARHPAAAFYLLPTRAWQLLAGATLAAYLIPTDPALALRRLPRGVLCAGAGWAGIATICAGFFLIGDTAAFPGFWALFPTLGAFGVILSIAADNCGPARILAAAPLVFIGQISYSLYLWHWPLIVIGKQYAVLHGRSPWIGTLIGAALSVVFAILAYWAVEQPLRRRGVWRKRNLLTIGFSFVAGACICVGISLHRPTADPAHLFDQPRFSGIQYSVAGWDRADIAGSTRYYDVAFPPDSKLAPDVWTTGGIIHAWGSSPPRVVIFGSSHSMMFDPLIDSICRQLQLSVAFFSADATPVFFPTEPNSRFPSLALAHSFDQSRINWITAWRPDILLVIDRWDENAATPAAFEQKLRNLLDVFSPKVGRIVLFAQVPVLEFGDDVNAREFVTRSYARQGRFPTIPPDSHERFRRSSAELMESMSRQFPNVSVLRVDSLYYQSDHTVRYYDGRNFLYADADHLTDAGADSAHDLVFRAIANATRADKR